VAIYVGLQGGSHISTSLWPKLSPVCPQLWRECSSFPRKRPQIRVPPPLLLNMSRGGDQTGVARTVGVPNILFFPIFVMPNACSVAASTSSGRFRCRAIKTISDRYEPVPEGLIWGLILPVDRFDRAATTAGFGWFVSSFSSVVGLVLCNSATLQLCNSATLQLCNSELCTLYSVLCTLYSVL